MSAQSYQASRPFLKLHYDFLEEVMPLLSGNEFKVTLVIYRETVGWNREQAPISYTHLEQRTGLNRTTLERIIKSLLKKGVIRLCDAVGRWGTHIYALAKRFITGNDDPETMGKTPIVQSPLDETMGKTHTVVWAKRPQNYGRNDTSSMGEMHIDEPPPVSYDAAPQALADDSERGAKETLIEKKETLIEREPEEEEKEVQEEEPYAVEWITVLEKIKPQVSPGAYGSWFRSTKAFKRDDQFIIKVESSFHKAHMQRFAKLIRSILDPLLPSSMDVFIATADELAPARNSA